MILNRPPVNSLGMNFMQEIIKAVDTLENGDHKGVILTSSSKSVFCAGLDFSELYNPSEPRLREFWSILQEMFYRLYSLKIPSAALIGGHAPAGGTLLTNCCDYRVMVNNPKFTIGLNEVIFGLPPPFWLIDSFRAVVGQRQAELAVQRGQLFSPEQALAIGLVDKLVDDVPQARDVCNDVLHHLTSKVVPDARNTVKIELRKTILERVKQEGSKDIDFSVGLILKKEMQETLGKYLAALSQRKK